MKQKTIKILAVTFLIGLMHTSPSAIFAQAAYAGGSGTESDPYTISTPEELNQLQVDVNSGVETSGKHYKLLNNIDLNGFDSDNNPSNGNWTPIGLNNEFKGVFDGDGYTIKGMRINLPTTDSIGLFGLIGNEKFSQAVVRNVSLVDANVVGRNSVGLLVGESKFKKQNEYLSLIQEVFVQGQVIASGINIGGVIGINNGVIRDASANVTVSGNDRVGGLVGGSNGKEYTSLSVSSINLSATLKGGVVGFRGYGGLENCYFDKTKAPVDSSPGQGAGLESNDLIGERAKEVLTGFDFNTVWTVTDGYPSLVVTHQKPEVGPDNAGNTTINGNISGTIISFTVPTELSFLVNPNANEGERFVAPEFTVSNDSNSPLTLSVGTFEETTEFFTDVHGDRYQDSEWDKLGVKDSKQFALALNLEEGENWLVQTQLESLYAATVQDVEADVELGTIRPNSDVAFNFSAKHGLAFKEALNPEYSITFILDLFNE